MVLVAGQAVAAKVHAAAHKVCSWNSSAAASRTPNINFRLAHMDRLWLLLVASLFSVWCACLPEQELKQAYTGQQVTQQLAGNNQLVFQAVAAQGGQLEGVIATVFQQQFDLMMQHPVSAAAAAAQASQGPTQPATPTAVDWQLTPRGQACFQMRVIITETYLSS